MSSPSRPRPERGRRRAVAVIALLLAPLLAPAPARAAVPLPVAGVLSGGGETTLVVDLSASNGTGRRTVEVTLNGQQERADLVPVMSDGLAVTIVVDASAAGAATLPAWLSAAARFILEAPTSTQAVVIPDRRPATAATGVIRGPSGVVGALTGMRADGDRDTEAALTLARTQFPRVETGHRVVMLYTSAPDAGGARATDLADDFRAAGTILVVVGTAAASGFWSGAAGATGGFFAPASEPVVVPALDQVESTLSNRYLVCFATPPKLPATVAVRIDTGDLTLTGDAVVPAPGDAHGGGPARSTIIGSLLGSAGLAAVLAVAILLIARARRPRPVAGPPALTSVFIGRAAAPQPARGRAAVPREHGTPWS
ncbi:hypothetical protein ODJ79_34205 [Actinoplanes sp. KI2]|uniref:hypothetical protein n=1 Tax=Actinoplanes sp. KI2 TaxID=2983315 RepID=UPI0021D60785|nr:hypothetical protein [Actinoplanes sp. KI2]MCU7728793.1 hypothetical protein [Actinoplanes sp. KI2]